MKGYTSRNYQGVPLGFEIRRQISKDKIFRVRHGNGFYGSTLGELIQDKFNYVVPGSINNSEGSYARDFLREAVLAWQALSESAKNVWRAKEKSCRGTTGYALFISDYIKRNYAVASFIKDADGDSYETIEKTADCDTLELYLKNILTRKFHDDGILDLPKQSACRARLTSAQTIPNTTWTKLTFGTEDYDVQNEFDPTTTHRFTVKKAGKYAIAINGYIDALGDGDTLAIIIEKNGAYVGGYTRIVVGTATTGVVASLDILSLAANDYIEMFIYHSFGANRDAAAHIYANYMSIHKLS